MPTQTGYAPSGSARLYYETAGQGQPLVMIHAGVADRRQWDGDFAHFADRFQVARYDLRGYGRSEPVPGEFSHMADLQALLDHLRITGPLILMGCSMGGAMAMNFTLAHPTRVRALIMVDSAPSGLELDTPIPPQFALAEQAFEAGDLDRTAELEVQVWFDGTGRGPGDVDPAARALVYEMNRRALEQEARELGKRLPDVPFAAAERLAEITIPVLVIVGANDTAYNLAAADRMAAQLPHARKVTIADAAHLPNLEHPAEFQAVVAEFLDQLPA